MKYTFNVRVIDAENLFKVLPDNKLLTFNLPAHGSGLVVATFTSELIPEELKKLIHQLTDGTALMESLKINYD